jgi:hypothetical protein
MYVVLLYVGKRLVRSEFLNNYNEMAQFVQRHRPLYSRCEVVPI